MIFSEQMLAAFCPSLKNLPEGRLKRFRLIALTKEVSKIPSIDFVPWLSLMKNVLNKHSKLRTEKYKMHYSSIKGAPAGQWWCTPLIPALGRQR